MTSANVDTGALPNAHALVAESPSRAAVLRRCWKSFCKLFNTWFLGPLLGGLVGTLIITRLINAFIGPNYSVYVVGPFGQSNRLADVFDKFDGADTSTWSIDGVPVRIHIRDDQGEPVAARRMAAELAVRDDTLLVIGHFQSTTTKEALPLYLSANPAIPVILTTETTTNVLPPKANADMHYPVFRLSPNDDVQAETAFEFAHSKGAKTFWIVQDDLSNTVYSAYLADKFMERAQSRETRVLLRTSPTFFVPSSTIDPLKIDWIFFAGGWRSALLFIRQLNAMHFAGAHIILSDACATKALLDAATGKELEGVYVTHPLDAKTFNEKHNSAYAEDSLALVKQLLEKAGSDPTDAMATRGGPMYRLRRLLGIHRVGDARNAIIHAMHVMWGEKLRLMHGNALFDKDGARIDSKFHIWKIEKNNFVDVP